MKKKVVIIVKYFYPIKRPSGISSFVYELARELAKQVDLSVISIWQEENASQEYQHDGYAIYKVKKPFFITAPYFAKKLKPDVVIIFSGIYQPIKTMLYFWPISCLFSRNERIFCQATNYNVKNLPGFYARFLKQFKAIIATNQLMREQYLELGLSSEHITPGVNINYPQEQSLEKIAKNKEVRIGFFGHFYPVKGPDRLLDAFLKIDPVNAELVFGGGAGPLKSKIESAAKNDRRISIINWREHIKPYLNSCDIVVLPYRDSYSVLGYAQAALEAMSLGIPVIGTKTASLEYLIRDGYNGYIVKSDRELEEKLKLLIENPNLRRELGNHARLTIEENFNIQKIADQYLKLIYGNR